MNNVERGKYCSHCSKAVIDFTTLSDSEILKVISKSKGELCGRLQNDQLNREIVPISTAKNKTPFYHLLAAMLSVSSLKSISATGQEQANNVGIEVYSECNNKPVKPIEPAGKSANVIVGRVLQGQGKVAVAGASIIMKGTRIGTAADAEGNFKLNFPNSANKLAIEIHAVGLKSKVFIISKNDSLSNKEFLLDESQIWMGEVVITRKHKRKWWKFWKHANYRSKRKHL